MTRAVILVACGVGIGVFGGCGGGESSLGEVTGQITFNGLPTAAEIMFEPIESGDRSETPGTAAGGTPGSGVTGRPSTGLADTEGRFTLGYTASQQGALVGLHRVSVRVFRPAAEGGATTLEDVVAVVKVTQFVRRVKPGRNRFHFAITY